MKKGTNAFLQYNLLGSTNGLDTRACMYTWCIDYGQKLQYKWLSLSITCVYNKTWWLSVTEYINLSTLFQVPLIESCKSYVKDEL